VTQVDVSPLLRSVLWIVLIVVAVVAGSIVLALLTPRIVEILKKLQQDVISGAKTVAGRSLAYVGAKSEAFWQSEAREPRAPLITELQQLRAAADRVGNPQIRVLEVLQGRIERSMSALRGVPIFGEIKPETLQENIAKASAGGTLIGIIFQIILALGVGIVNAGLLRIFFNDRIPYVVIGYPLPTIMVGDIFAVLCFMMEFGLGLMLHRSLKRSAVQAATTGRSGSTVLLQPMNLIPLALLSALALVEAMAYATLSPKFDLPHVFDLTPNSPFYGLAKYFLTWFGIAVTGYLAYMGHAIAESIEEYRGAHAERAAVRVLARGRRAAHDEVEWLQRSVDRMQRSASAMPADVVAEFQRVVVITADRPQSPPVEQTMRDAIAGAEQLIDPPPAPTVRRPVLRTRWQILASIFAHALLLLALVALCVFTGLEVVSYVERVTGALRPVVAWTIGIGTGFFAATLGLLGRSALRSVQYATPDTHALPEPWGKRIFEWAVAVLLLLALIGIVLLTAQPRASASSVMLIVLLGALQATAIIVLGSFVDAGILAIGQLVLLAYFWGMTVVSWSVLLVACAIAAVCYGSAMVLRLLAVPGDVVLSRFSGRPGAIVA
jgi:hypothetical protein